MSDYTIAALPAQLRATAAAWARNLPTTQKDRQAAIRAISDRAGLSLTAAREACEEAAREATKARNTRALRVASARTGRPIASIPTAHGGRGRKTALLLAGTPTSRLNALREEAVLAEYHSAYRFPTGGHGDEVVVLTDDPSKVGVRQEQSLDWNFYAKSERRPATITNTTITAPRDWRVRVQRVGLANVDGMVTLDAGRLEGAPDGVDLFAATWLVQGRGYSVTVERGYIARQGSTAYHGKTAQQALSGLRRKLTAAGWSATVRATSLETLLRRMTDADLDRLDVRVSDARAEGACEYGIRSWCHATGLPYEAGSATLRQVWAAYIAQPRTEARAAILHAVRRSRRQNLTAAGA
jgi:hypothetical protein